MKFQVNGIAAGLAALVLSVKATSEEGTMLGHYRNWDSDLKRLKNPEEYDVVKVHGREKDGDFIIVKLNRATRKAELVMYKDFQNTKLYRGTDHCPRTIGIDFDRLLHIPVVWSNVGLKKKKPRIDLSGIDASLADLKTDLAMISNSRPRVAARSNGQPPRKVSTHKVSALEKLKGAANKVSPHIKVSVAATRAKYTRLTTDSNVAPKARRTRPTARRTNLQSKLRGRRVPRSGLKLRSNLRLRPRQKPHDIIPKFSPSSRALSYRVVKRRRLVVMERLLEEIEMAKLKAAQA